MVILQRQAGSLHINILSYVECSLKSPYPDVLRPWGESQVYKNYVKMFEKMNPVVSKFLEIVLTPQCQAFQAKVVIFPSLFLNACRYQVASLLLLP